MEGRYTVYVQGEYIKKEGRCTVYECCCFTLHQHFFAELMVHVISCEYFNLVHLPLNKKMFSKI